MMSMTSLSSASCARSDSVRNIVVVGEICVGKSSLINLVTGSNSCVTGNVMRGTTTETQAHDWNYDGQTYRLWDTPGLSEVSFGKLSPEKARGELRSLLTKLSRDGGIHLILHCMGGENGVTDDMRQTYNTVAEMRDAFASGIPLAAVITELEQKSAFPDVVSSMENWWTENVATLSRFKMMFSAHACITTVSDDSHRYELCQELVRNLIKSTTDYDSVRNIIVVGESGVGKSSLINLVIGSSCCLTGGGLNSVTMEAKPYDWVRASDGRTYRLWDTHSLEKDSMSPIQAQNALRSLLMRLTKERGVHLIMFCMNGEAGVTTGMQQAYNTLVQIRNGVCSDIPLAAVITHLEPSSPVDTDSVQVSDAASDTPHATATSGTVENSPEGMEKWWTDNHAKLSHFKMTFSAHACITTLKDKSGRYECQELVRNLIVDRIMHSDSICNVRPLQPKNLHVVLFGETGVGKSSLINLLAGWRIATVSPESIPCTLSASEYQFQIGSTAIRLWDTAGLEEPDKDTKNYVGAVEQVVRLIRRLNNAGGISLFLFCIRGGRITATIQNNYRLFYEVLGKKEVPIAFAVTHLERESNMEDWWVRNGRTLEKNGIHSAGHACVTALDGHPKFAESRDALMGLLAQFDDQGKFSMPAEAWIGRILKGLGSLVKMGLPRGKELAGILVKRCHLSVDIAQRVAACIDSDS